MSSCDCLQQLMAIAEPALCSEPPEAPPHLLALAGETGAEALLRLLRMKNGFYAFACALHVFPTCAQQEGFDLIAWNETSLWRGDYGAAAEGFLFFAENLFGDQFALRDNRVWLFDPETGVAEPFADTLAGWASRILQDPEAVGFATALAWQQAYGDIPPGKRLFCKIPFVLGGTVDLSNLYIGDPIDALRWRADLARQLRGLPPGTPVRLVIED
ncbi:MAG: hypothetical protein KatS3mg021_1822 [Fimbriimonadales bacterium]|jgi:hypothetical protein|nr:MAG: hypothetical protein KatS3mg021_1822 [Fimbriimonadales bacterium]